MEKRYAPYPKWFGTAFRKLQAATALEPILQRILSATDWKARERHLVDAYEYVARLHNQLALTEPMPTKVSEFFDRPFLVISKEEFSKAIAAKITDPVVKQIAARPFIGGIDHLSDNTDLKENPTWRDGLCALYAAK
jgi:hypothetical protein